MFPLIKLSVLKIWVLSSLLFFPVLFLILLPLGIYEYVVKVIARVYRKDLKTRLTAYDSIFAVDKVYSEPYAGNVTILYVDGYLDIKSVRKSFESSVLDLKNGDGSKRFEKLFQIPTSFLGYYFWKDVHLDVNLHIKKVHDFSLEEDQHENILFKILGDLMTSPFPVLNGPLWEVLLFNGYLNGQSILLIRIHHTLGDGYTFNHLIDTLICQHSTYLVREVDRSWTQEVKLIATAPLLLGTLYKEGLASKRNYYTKRKVNSKGVLSMTTFDLERMKEIRRVTKTHFATVGMSLMCGALRRYFLENNPASDLPPWVSIMHSLPKPNHPLTKMVNHWNVGLFKIPINISSPIERLRKGEDGFMEYIKEQFDQLIHVHMPLMSVLPKFILEIFFSTNFGTSMGFTSVPAYEGQAYLWGHRVLHMNKIFGMQWRETAVATAVYTHNGKVGYTMFANRDIIPDQKSMDRVVKTYLHEEFEELALQTGVYSNISKSSHRLEPFA